MKPTMVECQPFTKSSKVQLEPPQESKAATLKALIQGSHMPHTELGRQQLKHPQDKEAQQKMQGTESHKPNHTVGTASRSAGLAKEPFPQLPRAKTFAATAILRLSLLYVADQSSNDGSFNSFQVTHVHPGFQWSLKWPCTSKACSVYKLKQWVPYASISLQSRNKISASC